MVLNPKIFGAISYQFQCYYQHLRNVATNFARILLKNRNYFTEMGCYIVVIDDNSVPKYILGRKSKKLSIVRVAISPQNTLDS